MTPGVSRLQDLLGLQDSRTPGDPRLLELFGYEIFKTPGAPRLKESRSCRTPRLKDFLELQDSSSRTLWDSNTPGLSRLQEFQDSRTF